jgi:hypothetical protein
MGMEWEGKRGIVDGTGKREIKPKKKDGRIG